MLPFIILQQHESSSGKKIKYMYRKLLLSPLETFASCPFNVCSLICCMHIYFQLAASKFPIPINLSLLCINYYTFI